MWIKLTKIVNNFQGDEPVSNKPGYCAVANFFFKFFSSNSLNLQFMSENLLQFKTFKINKYNLQQASLSFLKHC